MKFNKVSNEKKKEERRKEISFPVGSNIYFVAEDSIVSRWADDIEKHNISREEILYYLSIENPRRYNLVQKELQRRRNNRQVEAPNESPLV